MFELVGKIGVVPEKESKQGHQTVFSHCILQFQIGVPSFSISPSEIRSCFRMSLKANLLTEVGLFS
jgi:hypothetical protein